jgi:hypothetical protein
MAGKVDWKLKYYELRSKYLNALDVSFRLGHEEGQKMQKMKDLEAQQIQAEEEAMAAAAGADPMMGDPAMEGAIPEEGMEEGMEAAPMEEGGDDLDSSISELESYVKSEEKLDFNTIMKKYHDSPGLEKSEQKIDTSKKDKQEKVQKMIEKWDDESTEGLEKK